MPGKENARKKGVQMEEGKMKTHKNKEVRHKQKKRLNGENDTKEQCTIN